MGENPVSFSFCVQSYIAETEIIARPGSGLALGQRIEQPGGVCIVLFVEQGFGLVESIFSQSRFCS